MNRQIRILGLTLLVCFSALVVQLSIVQVIRPDEYSAHPANSRRILRDFDEPRGDIVTADGVVVAESVPSEGRFELLRTYPHPELYAHLTGYFSFSFGTSGVEAVYNDELAGETATQELRSLGDLFVERDRTGTVRLTVIDSVQRVAQQELGDRLGAVVALDPRDGAILAMWANPTFDPNVLSSHDLPATAVARELLLADDANRLRSRAYQERFFPGSTFKVVTAAAGLETGAVTPSEPSYAVTNAYTPPLTSRPIRNFGGSTCGGLLYEIMRVSCNTSFAEMGAETIGPVGMISTAEAFGFNNTPPIDLTDPAASAFPTDFVQDTPKLAQAAIGQNDVQGTPLQMALVAAAVANNGSIMRPHVLDEIRDGEGEFVREYDQGEWRKAMSASTAASLRVAMLGVVNSGTATRLQIPGFAVGGKTGTAQLGTDPPTSHAWIIAFAGPPEQQPVVAVAVLVQAQPGASEQTGGRVAAPIARAVIIAALESGRLPQSDEQLPPPSSVSGPSPSPPSVPASAGGPVSVAPTTSGPSTPSSTTPPSTTAAAPSLPPTTASP